VGTEVTLALELPVLAAPLAVPEARTVSLAETPSLRVLVVDDYAANRMLLSQQLAYLGHQVVEAEDGQQGLALWRTQRFDVVITDCGMPVMNGYEMARQMRAEELRSGADACSILGFTANAVADELARCQAAGMDDCLFKPASLAQLGQRLGSLQALPLSQAAPAEAPGVMDAGGLEELSGGQRDQVRALLAKLADSNREDLQRLDRLFAAHDHLGLVELAHRVKGGARMVRAGPLVKACEGLETASALTQAQLQSRVEQLRTAMGQFAEALDAYCRG
jgi:two-component system sensor histidine kinase EvgS